MRSVMIATLAAAVLLTATGCFPGIDAVRVGMGALQVEREICGKPADIIRGDGVDLDKMVFVYPTGRVYFFKYRVVKVEKAGEEPTITDQVRDQERNRILP